MCHLRILPSQNYNEVLATFRQRHGIGRIIGISGGANTQLPGIPETDPLQQQHAAYEEALYERILHDTLRVLRGYGVAILTGGTKLGIPRLAVQVARQHGFKTIGVLPQAGEHHALPDELLDLKIIVAPMLGEAAWGDEGPVWTSLIDGLVVIGGGAGTLTELAHIMKLNEARCKRGARPKFMVPIYGTGGVADQVHQLFSKPTIRDSSMPRDRVYSGNQAAHLLIDALDLDECFVGANR